MKKMHGFRGFAAWMLIMPLLLCLSRAGAEETDYVENELNYVEESMDPSGGIPEDASGVLARIKEKGVLRVATDGDWPPQEFYDPERGEYAGADMELARLIASRMGVRLELVVMPFEEVLPSLTEGSSDLAISALAFVPSRALQYTMSKGYYMSDAPITVIVIREEDKDSITSLDDLQGRTIIAQRGSLQESIIAGKIKLYKEFRRVAVEGDEGLYHLYEMLTEGSADALAMDIENAEDYLRDHPDCGLMIVPGDENRFVLEKSYQGDRVAARKGEYMLMYFVNGVIDEVLDVPAGGEATGETEARDMLPGLYTRWITEAEARWVELNGTKQTNDAAGNPAE